jgi:predicted DNA-binding antitoxin AbrB/MazE fold protein
VLELTVPKGAVSYTYMNFATILQKRRNRRMAETIRARVKAGRLELLEKINLPEGTEVSVTILSTPSSKSGDGLRRSAGGWKGLIDAEKLIENIYADRLISTRPVPKL